jgi:N-acetylmuramoyl-L-alanine amidase
MHKTFLKYKFLLMLLFLASCASKNGNVTAYKIHQKQLKGFVKNIQKKEPIIFNDRLKSTFIPTTNFNLRKPNFVIIHHTAQESMAQTIKTFQLEKTQVSAHYVISDDGKIVQMLNDYMRSWHGGAAKWGKNTDINSCSIGIELDNNGTEIFSEKQINSLLLLLEKLKKDYNIPVANFIGHLDIAPSRKIDPSVLFPWEKLAEKGFGLWPDSDLECAPENFDPMIALRVIGYDTSNAIAVIQSFQRHYLPKEISGVLDEKTYNTIYSIYKKQ